MIRGLGHPTERRLERFIDGGLGTGARARVAAHLLRCTACQRRVEEIEGLAQRLREMPVPELRPEVWTRIKGSIEAGTPVILPCEAPSAPPPIRRPHRLAAAALCLVLIVGGISIGIPRLGASHSHLELTPHDARGGVEVLLSYESGSLFPDQQTLRARAQVHGEGGRVEQQDITLHRRRGRGLHEGSFTPPPWAVYVAFAVEDADGARVDANSGLLWDLVLHDADGPLLAGLRQQVAHRVTLWPAAAADAARMMVAHHPDRPESWQTLNAVEGVLEGPQGAGERVERHRTRFEALERRLLGSAPAPVDLAWMALYARSVGGPDAFERWEERLLREAPGERAALQFRLQKLSVEHADDLPRLLDAYETLWQELGPSDVIAGAGFSLATRLGGGHTAVLWGDRWAQTGAGARLQVAIVLSRTRGTRAEGAHRLRAELRRVHKDRGYARPLDVSLPEHAIELGRTEQRVLAALGGALAAMGAPASALDTLQAAAELGWAPEVFETAAEVLLAQGDTTSALPLLARLVADPETAAPAAARMAALAREHLTPAEWEGELERAEKRMREQVLALALHRRLPSAMRAEDGNGASMDLERALRGEVALVALWYCLCEQFRPYLERHRALTARLEALDVPVFNVLTGRPSPGSPAAGVDGDFRVLHDLHGEVARAFGFARTPAYFIVDAEGVLQFAYPSAEEVVRQVEVLRSLPVPSRIAQD